MCGICGIYNPDKLPSEESQGTCARMTSAMMYRGPDDEGFFSNSRLVLGHRRLSIIDLSSGQQPMHNARRNQTIVFNGEIYNFLELRSELSGFTFRTKCDTEVILAGYEKWGTQVSEKLRGMFAFALYDCEQNILFAARDPLGKKPFYYHISHDGTFYFASDLQALAASGVLSGTISREALQHYFALGYIPAPLSIYEGVHKLQAGHALLYGPGGLKIWSYWDIDLSVQENGPEQGLAEKLEDLLNQAVRRRLMADVPLGALLSSGIDSNLVVAAMAKQTRDPVRTFTVGFSERAETAGTRDEREAAALAARYYGTLHEEISINAQSGISPQKLISYLGEPLADSSIIPTFLVCQAARKHLKVALTGDGGDEPFGGYSFRYLPHLAEARIRRLVHPKVLSLVSAFFAGVWPISETLPRALRLNTIFRNLAASGEEAFYMDQALRIMQPNPLVPEIANGHEPAIQRIRDLYNRGAGRDELTRILYVDVKLYMTENVLVKADRMSMANSIELRSPLLDQDVVAFAFSLPGQMKIRRGACKYLLKKLAARHAAPHILHLPKTGFSIPIDHYLRTIWNLDFEERVLRSNGPLSEYIDKRRMTAVWQQFRNGSNVPLQLLWAIYVLALWFSEFHQRQVFQSGVAPLSYS
jgi:asparagine synthase (glutamine-hydrolysing)